MLSACRPSLTASRKSSTFIVATPLPLRVVTSVDFSGVGASPAPFMAARWGYWYTLFSDKRAPVAQLDRASGYGPGGSGFESLRACHSQPNFAPRTGCLFTPTPTLPSRGGGSQNPTSVL